MSVLWQSNGSSGLDSLTSGTAPSGLTTSGGTWVASASPAKLSGHTNAFTDTSRTLNSVATFAGLTAVADAEIAATATLTLISTSSEAIYLGLRGNAAMSTGYAMLVQGYGAAIYIKFVRKTGAGTSTSYATISAPNAPVVTAPSTGATSVRLRFAVVGTTLYGKLWLASTAEPAAWSATATDSNVTAAGYPFFIYYYVSGGSLTGLTDITYLDSPSAASTAISVTTPADGVAATISGTFTGTAPAGLAYALNGATAFTAVSSPTIGSSTFSFPMTGLSNGANTVAVQATNATTEVASTAGFVGQAALSIGALTATPGFSGITLSLSAGLSGGTGTGFTYAIYRGTDANFTANASSLLATVSSLPYTDATATANTVYFYGIAASDSSGTTVYPVPAGTGTWTAPTPYYVAAQIYDATCLNIVFIGDSITYGATLTSGAGTVLPPSMPGYCCYHLRKLLGVRDVQASNQGVSSMTTTDWLPTGTLYPNAKAAMTALVTANPGYQPVFSIMLGTNDCAQNGHNNSPAIGPFPVTNFVANYKTIISQLLADFQTAKVVVHKPPYFSSNVGYSTSNTWLQPSLSMLQAYLQAIDTMVAGFSAAYPGQVFVGDTEAFRYFAQHYSDEMTLETGYLGNFHLHPTNTVTSDGRIGSESLGMMHAQGIAQALYGAKSTTVVSGGGYPGGSFGRH